MGIGKSATQPNYPAEKNKCFTLIYSILLSGYVFDGCSMAKRKQQTSHREWEITRNGILEDEGHRLVGMTQNTCV
jgi:hypothetical protein